MGVENKFPQVTFCTNDTGGRFIIYTTDDGEDHHVSNTDPFEEVFYSTSHKKCLDYCKDQLK